jgi:methylornithine synthase
VSERRWVDSILERAEGGEPLASAEILRLLSIERIEERQALFAAARRVRARTTGSKVFLYGFLYISTYCRRDCHFCFFRRSNAEPLRYRKSRADIVRAARKLADSHVHLIDLTMGEDPAYHSPAGVHDLADLVASVREATDLPVMISPGVVDAEALTMLKEAGASWYACYQETHNRSLFHRIRPGQGFDDRLDGKRLARSLGFLTEEGVLCGIGESYRDTVDSLTTMQGIEADQVRVMGFVPQNGTPLSDHPPGDVGEEVKMMAIMRLLFPDRLIPASLDVGGLRGLKARLQAGANVVTSIVPPGEGLAGVAQRELDIEAARRTVSSVAPVLEACGLAPATRNEHRRWMERRIGGQAT